MKNRRKYFTLISCTVMILMVFLTACNGGTSSSGGSSTAPANSTAAKESSSTSTGSTAQVQSSSSTASKILVAYFSQTGHTRTIADQIHDQTGGDLFEIVTVKPYPSDYNTLVAQVKNEQNSNYKPELKTKVKNINAYSVIFIGSPNWWGTIAPPVKTFLSEYDFSGKTIIPFIAHEGSALGNSIADLKKLCPKSTVLENGLAVRGSDVNSAQNTVSDWLKQIGYKK